MTTLLALLALVGQPVALSNDLGTCYGRVIAPGQAVLTEGSCALDSGDLLLTGDDPTRQDGDAVAELTHARTLPSGRIVINFAVLED